MESSPAQAESDLRERLAFLSLDGDDALRLQKLLPVFEAHAAQFVELFYQHLFAFPNAARFLTDPAVVSHLKQAQEDHLRTMLLAHWTPEYADQRRRVGDAHA